MKINEVIIKLRNNLHITQAELAKRSDVDFTTMSKIEKGTRGNLLIYQKIAKGLGISLADLYRGLEESPLSEYEVSQKKPSADIFYYNEKATSQILVKELSRRKMAPEILRLEKDGATHLEKKPIGTEQFIFVLDGNIEIKIADAIQQLKKGQSIYFDASRPHIIRNIAKTTVKCLRVSSPATL